MVLIDITKTIYLHHIDGGDLIIFFVHNGLTGLNDGDGNLSSLISHIFSSDLAAINNGERANTYETSHNT